MKNARHFSLLFTISFSLLACTLSSWQEDVLKPTSSPIILPTLTVIASVADATPFNTMTSQEQKNFIKEFLFDSGDCQLPCWWNIPPDQTWTDAEKRIHNLGGSLIEVFPGYDSEATVYLIDIDALPINNLYLEKKHGAVYAWHVLSTGGVVNPDRFGDNWESYLAQNIINRYGRPERILINSSPSFNSLEYGLYSLWLFYDKLGFSIRYDARIPKSYSNSAYFNICPSTDPLLNLEFNMQSPNNPLPLDRFDLILEDIRLQTETGKITVLHTIQKATGLNDEEIYNVFMQEKNPCFAISSDIWKPSSTP